MAQQRLRNYEHPILSFEHNVFNLGFHTPGRYIGFDAIVKIQGLQFFIAHTGRNLTYMDPNNNTLGPIGMYLTPQGTIIQETANIGPFNLDSNAGNVNYRYDLIYAIHNQIEINGGQDATYAVLKGSMASNAKPTVPNPQIHTPLGYVELPPGEAGDINNCKWLKSKSPDSGDGPDARIDEINMFSQFQGFALSQTTYLAPTKIDAAQNQLWKLNSDGNTFRIFPNQLQQLDAIQISNVTPQEGNRIYIHINENVKFLQTDLSFQDIGDYKGFKLRDQFLASVAINPDLPQVRPSIQPGAGEIWELTAVFMDNLWVITDIGGKRPLIPSAPNLPPYADNITQIVPGSAVGQFGIYTPPAAVKYPILFANSFHVGDLKDPGLDYIIEFGIELPTANYVVAANLRAGPGQANNNSQCTGVWVVISKTTTNMTIHVNEYSHDLLQDLYFDFCLIQIG